MESPRYSCRWRPPIPVADGNWPSRIRPQYDDVRILPKVELHAHLFGSASREYLRQRWEARRAEASSRGHEILRTCQETRPTDMTNTFKYFNWVYECIIDLKEMADMAKHVVGEFAKDGVLYLELRTTVKNGPSTDVTPESYVDMLTATVDWAAAEYGIICRLLLSINRSKCQTQEAAAEHFSTFLRALKHNNKYVVGVDFCGNPDAAEMRWVFANMDAILDTKTGLILGKYKFTFHTAERDRESESWSILRRHPHRIGHGSYLTDEQKAFITEEKIYVETCPASNVTTMGLRCFCEHPYGDWYRHDKPGHRYCISTDDTGLFDTSLSNEVTKMVENYSFSLQDIIELQRCTLEKSFLSAEEVAKVAAVLDLKTNDFLARLRL